MFTRSLKTWLPSALLVATLVAALSNGAEGRRTTDPACSGSDFNQCTALTSGGYSCEYNPNKSNFRNPCLDCDRDGCSHYVSVTTAVYDCVNGTSTQSCMVKTIQAGTACSGPCPGEPATPRG
jgi:hypothetical protein